MPGLTSELPIQCPTWRYASFLVSIDLFYTDLNEGFASEHSLHHSSIHLSYAVVTPVSNPLLCFFKYESYSKSQNSQKIVVIDDEVAYVGGIGMIEIEKPSNIAFSNALKLRSLLWKI